MSRSNPYKKKRRTAKATKLIYGEGQGEEIFLKHLRSLYGQNSGIAITIKRGKGGTPEGIVLSAINQPGDFQSRLVVIDNDKSKKEMESARTKAANHGIGMIENTPCLESFLLNILEEHGNFKNKKSHEYKKIFEGKYISKKQRDDGRKYEQLFTKKALENRRKKLPLLNRLIKEIGG